jgi:hypothetical protein
MDAKLREIMERGCQIGRLLPAPEDVDRNDPAQMAEVRTILAEFEANKKALWARIRELNNKRS